MGNQISTLAQKIRQLRHTYFDKLPDRLANAKQLCELLLNNSASQTPENTIASLHLIFHSIRGTASSLGLGDIRTQGEVGEKLVAQLKQIDPASRKQEFELKVAELSANIDKIDQLCDRIARSKENVDASVDEAHFLHSSKDGEDVLVRRKVLIFADKEELGEQLSAELGCFGYAIIYCTDPEKLRTALTVEHPNAIIIDLDLFTERGTGLEIVSSFLRNPQVPPVVFVSFQQDFTARLKAVQAGGDAYFPKPIKASDLVASLDTLISDPRPEQFRVLIVDDEVEVAAYHSLILEQAGMVTRTLSEPANILNDLTEFKPDIVLMDMYMPGCSGKDLSHLIRQIPEFISLPIIFLSMEKSKAKQLSALRIGAEGFLTKPIRPEELVDAVTIRAERMRTLRSLMVRDSLTGLFNHTVMSQLLMNSIASAERTKSILCFVMIDVDFFKKVNDTYGHPAGDQVLIALARMLRQRLRGSDMVGRYGGEEFSAILTGASVDEAAKIIDQIRQDFSKIHFYCGQHRFSCTFSGGVAAFPEFQSAEELLVASDQALYKAKDNGRNRIAIGTKNMDLFNPDFPLTQSPRGLFTT